MDIQVSIINAFVDEGAGGNPAGVVLDADHLSTAEKQQIAALVGVSETAFVSRSDTADFKLDFFTPKRQIAHCGHATVATFCYLAQIGRLMKTGTSKETIDGDRAIFMDGDRAFMAQTAPIYTELSAGDQARAIAAVGLDRSQLVVGGRPLLVNTGNTFLLFPVKDLATLKQIEPNLAEIEAISDAHDLVGFHLFSRETEKPGRVASARMFAPRYGIVEEAATGTATGTQACYLYDVIGVKETEMVMEQGIGMRPSAPSELFARLHMGKTGIESVRVGGRAQVMSQRKIMI